MTWDVKASMPTARYDAGAAEGSLGLYVIGGADNGGSLLTVNEVYDPATDSWSTKTAMPTARRAARAASASGRIWCVGGFDGTHPLTTNEGYDSGTDSWSTFAPITHKRQEHALVTAGAGLVYAIGGFDSDTSTVLSSTEAYDPASDTWSAKAPLPAARMRAGYAVISGILYVVGGLNAAFGNANNLYAYDPAIDTWSTKTAMPTARQALMCGVYGGQLFAIGGTTGTPQLLVEVYDPASDTWSTGEALASELGQAASLSVLTIGQEAIWVFGGNPFFSPITAQTLRYEVISTEGWTVGYLPLG